MYQNSLTTRPLFLERGEAIVVEQRGTRSMLLFSGRVEEEIDEDTAERAH